MALTFKPVTLDSKELFRKYASPQLRNCDAAFANIFCWQQTYHSSTAEIDGRALVVKYRVEGSGETACMLFCRQYTAELLAELIPLLEEDAAAEGRRLRITGLPSQAADIIRRNFGGRFACAAGRDNADYLYNAAELRNLAGRKYQPKRNHLNRFNDLYSWSYEPLAAHHKAECIQLESRWQQHHHSEDAEHDLTVAAERAAIERAFDNFDALNLMGGLLRIDGQAAAFTYGSPVNDEVFDIHVEKADTAFDGIFPAINRLFAQTIPDNFTLINREEDMGLDGLRRSKLSYHPAELEYKFTALALTDRQMAIRRLWEEAFGDERDFADAFLVEQQRYGITPLLACDGERLAAMLHTVPFVDSEGNRAVYIYGVATAAEFRRRGLASQLLAEALRTARHRFDYALLIPADEALAEFYRRRGFGGPMRPVTFAADFDFGSGAAETDLAMVLPLRDIQPPQQLLLHPAPRLPAAEPA